MKQTFIFSLIFVAILTVGFFAVVAQPVEATGSLYCPLSAGEGDVLVHFSDTKLFSSREDRSHTSVQTTIPAGTYDITLVGMDEYSGRANVTQPKEQYFLNLKSGSQLITQTGSLQDLQDRTTRATQTTVVNRGLVISSTVTNVEAFHSAYLDTSNANSIIATCALFEKVETEEDLIGSCSASPSVVQTEDVVTWQASASGGDGKFQYSWSGTNGLTGSNATTFKRYSSEGTKNGSVTITSGSQSITRNCSVFVDEEPDPEPENFDVVCQVSDTRIEEGDRVTFEVDIDGGDSPYDIEWDGDIDDIDDFDDNDRRQTVRIDDEGQYRIDVEVTDDEGRTRRDSCPVVVVDEEDEDFEVTCEVSDTRIEEGDRVTFEVDIDGGDSPYDIEWDGDIDDIDDFDDNDRRQTVRIDDEGRYRIDVEVTDDEGRRASDDCRTIVVNEEDDDEDDVVVVTTTGGQVAGVALSQVPYTGFTDNPVLNAVLYSLAGFTLLVIGSVSLFILRKRDVVPVFVGKNKDIVATADYSEKEIVSALEDAAHKKRVIVSADAMDMIMLRSKQNKVKALILLNKAVSEAKKDISTEAWLVLSKQKIVDVL